MFSILKKLTSIFSAREVHVKSISERKSDDVQYEGHPDDVEHFENQLISSMLERDIEDINGRSILLAMDSQSIGQINTNT